MGSFDQLPNLIIKIIISYSLRERGEGTTQEDDDYDITYEVHHKLWRYQLGFVCWKWFKIVSRQLLDDLDINLRNKIHIQKFKDMINGIQSDKCIISNLESITLHRVMREIFKGFHHNQQQQQLQLNNNHNNSNEIQELYCNNNDSINVNKKSTIRKLKIKDDIDMEILDSIINSTKFSNLMKLEIEMYGWDNVNDIKILADSIKRNKTIQCYKLIFHEYGCGHLDQSRYLPLLDSLANKSGELIKTKLRLQVDCHLSLERLFEISSLYSIDIVTSTNNIDLLLRMCCLLRVHKYLRRSSLKICKKQPLLQPEMENGLKVFTRELAYSLCSNRGIKRIQLSSVPMYDGSVFQALSNHPSITSLSLHQCLGSNKQLIEMLCQMIKLNTTITSLSIIDYNSTQTTTITNTIENDEGVEDSLKIQFAESIGRYNQSIQSLRIDHMDIISNHFFKEMCHNQHIKSLTLHECIGQSMIPSLSTMLTRNKTITSLSINYNDLKEEEVLLESLEKNKTLTKLDISSNDFKMDKIFNSLQKSDSIENLIYYSFHGLQIHEKMPSFKEYYQSSKSLKYVNGHSLPYLNNNKYY